MTDDVVAELDRWVTRIRTAKNASEFVPMDELLQRARDEIVALREAKLARPSAYDTVRNQALEEAARVVEDYFNPETCGPCAAAIRKLKERPMTTEGQQNGR